MLRISKNSIEEAKVLLSEWKDAEVYIGACNFGNSYNSIKIDLIKEGRRLILDCGVCFYYTGIISYKLNNKITLSIEKCDTDYFNKDEDSEVIVLMDDKKNYIFKFIFLNIYHSDNNYIDKSINFKLPEHIENYSINSINKILKDGKELLDKYKKSYTSIGDSCILSRKDVNVIKIGIRKKKSINHDTESILNIYCFYPTYLNFNVMDEFLTSKGFDLFYKDNNFIIKDIEHNYSIKCRSIEFYDNYDPEYKDGKYC